MNKILHILDDLISEQKRDVLDPQLYSRLESLANKLWANKDKEYTRKTFVEEIPFKTKDGADGLVKIVINPRLKYIGLMDTKPPFSRDPMDFVMELQPKSYGSKKNLFLTIYHEMMHATDPTQSTKTNMKYQSSYSEFDDKKYWGHPIEFRAISNEFLEALVLEFKRRVMRLRIPENKKFLIKSLENIIKYFKEGTPLSKLSLDILTRMNDENVLENRFSKLLSDITTEFPQTSEFLPKKEDEPYFLTYVLNIKNHNPEIWKRFLTMLFKTSKEIEQFINNTPDSKKR
jgi:hypothetical protein